MTYYKVLHRQNKKLFSIAKDLSSVKHLAIRYIRNKWMKSKDGSPLFVFNSLNDVKSFIANKEIVYECEIIPYDKPWFTFDNKTVFQSDCFFPAGTIFAKSVKITKRIR